MTYAVPGPIRTNIVSSTSVGGIDSNLLFFEKNNKFIICSILIILFSFLNFTFSEKDFIFSAYSNYIFLEFIFGMVAYKIWKKFSNSFSISSLNHFLFLLSA